METKIVIGLCVVAWTYVVLRFGYTRGRRRGLYLGDKVGYRRRKRLEYAKAYGATNRKLRELIH
jgi:hypothetical protein